MLVAYERIHGWCERFGARHGGHTRAESGGLVRLTGADGAVAEYVAEAPPTRFGLILVRRGGYAIGLVESKRIVASKCGTRYVQGRTKAGGWSQQRYARRRANQADELAAAAGEAVHRVLGAATPLLAYGGGDRRLVDAAVDTSRVRGLTHADRWLDIGEPRRKTLDAASEQVRAVSIELNELA